jgi:hypothetical protein
MVFFITFWVIVAAITIGLSLPPALRTKSWKCFFLAAFLVFVGILFPLFIFLMSMFLVPEWKGECHHGWLDCFHVGKLALTPLVLWASAAFYTVQILKPVRTPRAWVDLGIFNGAITSTACLILGLVIHAFRGGMAWWLLVPLYVSVWYAILCIRVIRSSRRNPALYLITLAGSLPLWSLSMFWSKKHYLSLPDNPPSCFVVTAAVRGHEWLVGPFSTIERRGVQRVVNSQLATFWLFERLWAIHRPRTHRIFRRIYNLIGPRVASRVASPVAADLVYLLLKPLEVCATVVVRCDEFMSRVRGKAHR